MTLLSTIDSHAVRESVSAAWDDFAAAHMFDDDVDITYEHGQWWVIALGTGASWSVVDAEPGIGDTGLDFEQVDRGEEL